MTVLLKDWAEMKLTKNFVYIIFLRITINDLTSFGGKLALKMIYCRVRQITPSDVGDSPNFLFGFKDFFFHSQNNFFIKRFLNIRMCLQLDVVAQIYQTIAVPTKTFTTLETHVALQETLCASHHCRVSVF